jgi:hypothetical protein
VTTFNVKPKLLLAIKTILNSLSKITESDLDSTYLTAQLKFPLSQVLSGHLGHRKVNRSVCKERISISFERLVPSAQ